jgi:hypothetical protein
MPLAKGWAGAASPSPPVLRGFGSPVIATTSLRPCRGTRLWEARDDLLSVALNRPSEFRLPDLVQISHDPFELF